jgi:T-complex protein 1 subunit theta
MALHVPQGRVGQMMKDGTKHFNGVEEAVYRNVQACKDIAKIVKSSFGPNGMNKMIINHLDRLFVTNDAATIIRELEVEHPAAKLLVLASQQQEHEVGDGTNFVLVFAAELLKKSEGLLRMGLSPAEVLAGFEKAADKALEIMPSMVCYTATNVRDVEEMKKCLKTCLMSKQYGYEEFLADLVATCCVESLPTDRADSKEDRVEFNVDNIRVAKIVGQGVLSSTSTKGMIFRRDLATGIDTVENAKVAVYSGPVDWMQTETKGTVLIKSADELKAFSKGEESQLEGQIKAIVDAGANVVVTGSKFGEMAEHFLNKYNVLMVKILSKHELRRLCKTIGATPLPRLTAPSASEMGNCDVVAVEEIGDVRITAFRQVAESSALSTVVIRGATDNIMDDVQRAVDDGVNVFKQICRDPRFVPGAGATEIELALQLQQYAAEQPGLDQYAINAFAEALEEIPHALADNAGVKAKDVVACLYAAHTKGEATAGFDNTSDVPATVDAAAAGIWDGLSTKHWGIRYATTAANTVLRVDQIIMAKRAGGPKPGGGGPPGGDMSEYI